MRRRVPDVENKLLVLLSVEELGPLTGLQLLQFLAENDLMDYITLQLALGELYGAGHLKKIPHPLGELFALTPPGRRSLALFSRRVPHSKQALLERTRSAWRERFRREKQMLAAFGPREEGGYGLRLRLMEKELPLLDMTLFLESRGLSDRFSRRWPGAAPGFYGHLMEALGQGFSEENVPEELPPGAALAPRGRGDWRLTLRLGAGAGPALEMTVSLPTRGMALLFAEAWPRRGAGIRAFLMARLEEGPEAEV